MAVITPQAPLSKTLPVAPVAQEVEAPLEAPAASKQEEALSPRFAALAREQKAIRQRQQALKAQEEAFLKKQQEYEQGFIPKDRIKSDPLSVLLENGYTYDQIAQALLNQAAPKDPNLLKMEQKILELEQKAQEPMKKFEELQAQQREQGITNIRNETKLLVDSDASFETIKEMGAQEAVVSYIVKVFDETGELLSVTDAAKHVEDELFNRALKVASLKKVQSKLTSPLIEAQKQAAAGKLQPQQQSQTPIKTLTNAAVAAPSRPRTSAERLARAKAAFLGQSLP